MNCPYMWANSMDEEDEQVSSWESEPEGGNAEELANLETPDDDGEWCRPRRNRITGWSRRVDPRPAFRCLAEDAGGAQWMWEEVTVVADSGAAENVMPMSMFPEISTEETERSKNGKVFKESGGEHIKNYGQQVMSVRTPEGFVRKSTWHVADVRRPLVSASHIIQAGNDLLIGKDEAYIMNRKKKETSVLRERKGMCTCLICS